MSEKLIDALREHRDQLNREVMRVEEMNSRLLANNVELEIQVGQLKMELEERDKLIEAYSDVYLEDILKGEV